jgi:hypothetical protein
VKSILTIALLSIACHVAAQTAVVRAHDSIDIERIPFGSGTPAVGVTAGTDEASHVADGLYHAPNYLPGFPTAATIWPREVPVECTSDAVGKLTCGGYDLYPGMGRGEYIFVRPTIRAVPAAPVEQQLPMPEPAVVTRKKPLG